MVVSPQWVIYLDNLHRVKKQIGDKLYLISDKYLFGWHDPRAVFKGLPVNTDEHYLIVDVTECSPITNEVADIIRSV
jgi:hypothetical protein